MNGKGVPSPCVNVCRLDSAGRTCVGCRRTIDEIAAWGTMSDADKIAVWQRLAALGTPSPAAAQEQR